MAYPSIQIFPQHHFYLRHTPLSVFACKTQVFFDYFNTGGKKQLRSLAYESTPTTQKARRHAPQARPDTSHKTTRRKFTKTYLSTGKKKKNTHTHTHGIPRWPTTTTERIPGPRKQLEKLIDCPGQGRSLQDGGCDEDKRKRVRRFLSETRASHGHI